jgi:hypothetical protein
LLSASARVGDSVPRPHATSPKPAALAHAARARRRRPAAQCPAPTAAWVTAGAIGDTHSTAPEGMVPSRTRVKNSRCTWALPSSRAIPALSPRRRVRAKLRAAATRHKIGARSSLPRRRPECAFPPGTRPGHAQRAGHRPQGQSMTPLSPSTQRPVAISYAAAILRSRGVLSCGLVSITRLTSYSVTPGIPRCSRQSFATFMSNKSGSRTATTGTRDCRPRRARRHGHGPNGSTTAGPGRSRDAASAAHTPRGHAWLARCARCAATGSPEP